MLDTLKDSILSPQYLLELMFMCFCQLRLWFFIGSLEELVTLHIPKHDFATSKFNMRSASFCYMPRFAIGGCVRECVCAYVCVCLVCEILIDILI